MTSVNKKEIDKFSKMANEWWDPEGKFKPLHKFNPTRIKYIKENIINNFKLKNKSKPLSGIKILAYFFLNEVLQFLYFYQMHQYLLH